MRLVVLIKLVLIKEKCISISTSKDKVLSAIEKIPRVDFIPENFRNQAYENIALPIIENQTINLSGLDIRS